MGIVEPPRSYLGKFYRCRKLTAIANRFADFLLPQFPFGQNVPAITDEQKYSHHQLFVKTIERTPNQEIGHSSKAQYRCT
jgi:hypothetical protein